VQLNDRDAEAAKLVKEKMRLAADAEGLRRELAAAREVRSQCSSAFAPQLPAGACAVKNPKP
jgi:hypothetical protein